MPQRFRWQDALLTVGGGYLFATPWIYDFTGTQDASWTAWILGGVIAVIGLAALAVPRFEIAEWAQILAGALLFAAPWALTFDSLREAAWNAWVGGPVAAVLAVWAIYDIRRQPVRDQAEVIKYPRAA